MVFETLSKLIFEIGITEELDYSSTLHGDLQMDSTELIFLSTGITKEFGLTIHHKDLKDYSIGQVVQAIESNPLSEVKVQ